MKRKYPPELKKRALAKWLRENPDLTFCQDHELCPIAIFLGSGCDHRVSALQRTILIDEVEYSTPGWAQRFMERFDNLRGPKVRGKRALTALA